MDRHQPPFPRRAGTDSFLRGVWGWDVSHMPVYPSLGCFMRGLQSCGTKLSLLAPVSFHSGQEYAYEMPSSRFLF